MTEQILKGDGEIELIDLLSVIWKWKIFIAGITSLSTIAVFVYLFFSPSFYRCSMLIKPKAFLMDNLNVRYIGEPRVIKNLISSNALDKKILDRLKINRKNISQNGLSFQASVIKKTDHIKVICYDQHPERGVGILNAIVDSLNDYYQPGLNQFSKIEQRKVDKIDLQMLKLKNNFKQKTSQKNSLLIRLKKELPFLEQLKISLINQIKHTEIRIGKIKAQQVTVQKRYDTLVDNHQSILMPSSDKKRMNDLIYFNAIMMFESKLDRFYGILYGLENQVIQGKRKLIEIDKKLETNKSQKEDVLQQILLEKDEFATLNSKLEIRKMKFKKKGDVKKEAVEKLIPPFATEKPVKPKKQLIIPLVFAVSFFLSILATFVLEYFRKYFGRNRSNSTTT